MPNTFTRHWAQRLRDSHKPAYLLIPELLAEDLASGRLTSGDRLPPLRELAQALGLNYTTVARGLAEAQKRGQIDARPGRGSFVRSTVPALPLRGGTAAEMTMNLPPEPDDPALLARMAEGCQQMYADPRRLMAHLRYQDFGGTVRDREAGMQWIRPRIPDCRLDQMLVCPGIHSALTPQSVMSELPTLFTSPEAKIRVLDSTTPRSSVERRPSR